MEILTGWALDLGLNWGLLATILITFVLVILANKAGLTKSGDSKRLVAGIVAVTVASLRLYLVGVIPNEEIALWLFGAIVNWLGSAGVHTASEKYTGSKE